MNAPHSHILLGMVGPHPVAVGCLVVCLSMLVWLAPALAAAGESNVGAGIVVMLVGDPPLLEVMRPTPLKLRIINSSHEKLRGRTPDDCVRRPPCLYLGAWFAPGVPRVLSEFQHTLLLETSVLPGDAVDIVLRVTPPRPGTQYLGFGLSQTSGEDQLGGPVGRFNVLQVDVAKGSWFRNHHVDALRTMVVIHWLALVASLLLLIHALARAR